MATDKLRIEGIYTYPLKSGRPWSIQDGQLQRSGLRHDRRFALADPNGKFISLRTCPQMVSLGCLHHAGQWQLTWEGAPGPSFAPKVEASSRTSIEVWGDVVDVAAADDQVNDWVSRRLGRPVTLVAYDDASHRPVDPTYAPPGMTTMLADGFPLLLTSMESHAALDAWVGEPMEVGRMRPNLLVSGGAPFEEDSWVRLQGTEVSIELVKPCARCVATTVCPKTGHKGAEPLRSLAVHRKVNREVLFGQNAIVHQEGIVRVGEVLRIVSRR